MAWISLGNTISLFPGLPVLNLKVEERGMPLNIQIKTANAVQGYDVGTIVNPNYGSGVIVPLAGDVEFERPISGALKPRPATGIVYPVP